PVSERPEQPARERRERRIKILLLCAQQWIQIFAGQAIANPQQTLEVIDAGAPDLDPPAIEAGDTRDIVASPENTVAQAYGGNRRVFAERQDDPALWIGKVDEQRVRADLQVLARDVEHERQGAQREEKPARPPVFAKGVPDAVPAGNLEVVFPEAVSVDRRCIDYEIGAVQ